MQASHRLFTETKGTTERFLARTGEAEPLWGLQAHARCLWTMGPHLHIQKRRCVSESVPEPEREARCGWDPGCRSGHRAPACILCSLGYVLLVIFDGRAESSPVLQNMVSDSVYVCYSHLKQMAAYATAFVQGVLTGQQTCGKLTSKIFNSLLENTET